MVKPGGGSQTLEKNQGFWKEPTEPIFFRLYQTLKFQQNRKADGCSAEIPNVGRGRT